jgi:rare lipoprotein A (peptidoglycan hydrolase)
MLKKLSVAFIATFSLGATVAVAHVDGCHTTRCDHVAARAYHKHRPHPAKGCHTAACDAREGREYARKHPPVSEGQEATASWYADAGATASGRHYTYGVAHKTLAFGTRLRICHSERCVVATVDDRGPFIAGRDLDLNAATKNAIGCGDICQVRFRVL